MKANDISVKFEEIFTEIKDLRKAGQKEYALDSDSFSNFNKLSQELGIPREAVLWTYAMKHKDGIASHIRGNVSQREDVRGRINDLIVYMMLLRCMLDEKTITATA